jgi:hypothetical protein
MEKQCFRKTDSDTPVCGLHNVPLVRKQLPDELIASGYKGFTFLACPVSGQAFNDEATDSLIRKQPAEGDAAGCEVVRSMSI